MSRTWQNPFNNNHKVLGDYLGREGLQASGVSSLSAWMSFIEWEYIFQELLSSFREHRFMWRTSRFTICSTPNHLAWTCYDTLPWSLVGSWSACQLRVGGMLLHTIKGCTSHLTTVSSREGRQIHTRDTFFLSITARDTRTLSATSPERGQIHILSVSIRFHFSSRQTS